MRQKRKPLFFAVLFVGMLAIMIVIFAIANLRGRIRTNALILAPAAHKESMLITSQEQYVQTFTSDGTFDQIRLYFCSYDRENELSTTVQLMDIETETIFQSWEIDNNNITDEFIEFELEKEKNKGSYKLIISGKNPNPETSIGVYLQNKGSYSGNLFVSEKPQNLDISIGLYKKTYIGFYILIGILSASIICVFLASVLLFIYKIDLWKVSFALIMGFGCIYLALFTSSGVNDSRMHYLTVYQYSNELLGIERSASGTVMMRADDRADFSRVRKLARPIRVNIDMYFEEIDEFSLWCLDKRMVDTWERDLSMGEHSIISRVSYFPQTLGLTFGRILSLGAIPCMYLARFLQLFTVATLISFSIKIIPIGKEMLMLLALLPIFQQQITSFSYDGISFGFAFLFISICIKLIWLDERASTTDYMIVLIATVGLCACRGGMYAFLLILFLLIPKEVLGIFPKTNLFCTGIFTVLSFFVASNFTTPTLANNLDSLIYGSPFKHPINVGLHFISTIIEDIDNLWGSSFGQKMGWSESIIPYFLVFGFTLMILIVSLPDNDCIRTLDIKSRLICLLPVVFVLGFCLGAMYLGEPGHANRWYIWGVQGRYLIPVMPLLFLQVQNDFIVLKKNIRPAIIYIFCIWEVVEIFYLMRTFIIR